MYLNLGTHGGSKRNLLTIMGAQSNPISIPDRFKNLVLVASTNNSDVVWVGDGDMDTTKQETALAILSAGQSYEYKTSGGGNTIQANTVWLWVPSNDNQGLNYRGSV